MSMPPEDVIRRSEEILYEALDRPVEGRERFVDDVCGEDSGLRAEVQSLLAAHDRARGFLETPVVASGLEAVEEPAVDPLVGETVGGYRILRPIASGGMGRVYLAERAGADFVQRVALKTIRRDFRDEETVRRFRRECRVLARLEHPHIARMIDGGTTGDGIPYLVMEYVEGRPIDEYCEANGLSVRERLELFETVCHAVHHAHRHATVHRDLKPANLLVDDEGRVKLVDFGIARVLEAAEEDPDHALTAPGARILTPPYASPEQLRGEPVSTATDVYSLGLVLYRLLTGRLPFGSEPSDLRSRAEAGTTARRASEAVLQAADGALPPDVDTRRLSRRLRGDLDTILAMALRPEPDQRYASAEQFAEDLRRERLGLPVAARPDTAGYRVSRFVRRNRLGVGAAILLGLVLVASTGVTFSLYRRAEGARQLAETARLEAERNATTAEQVTRFVTGLFRSSDPKESLGQAVTARELLDRGAERVRDQLQDQPLVKARVLRAIGQSYQALGLPDEARPLYEESLAISREDLADEPLWVAEAVMALADLVLEGGSDGDALALYREALALKESALGSDHASLAPLLNRVALGEQGAGNFARAEELFEQSLAVREATLGSDHPEIAYYTNNLALLLAERGDFARAETVARRTLALREAALPAESPLIGTALSSLGGILNQEERFAEAAPLLERALALRTAAYGDSHPLTARAGEHLADSRLALGDIAAAHALYARAETIWRETYGEDVPNRVHSLIGLGNVALAEGDLPAAEGWFERALTLSEETYGADHPTTARALIGMGRLRARQGETASADSCFTRAIAIRTAHYGAGHPLVAAAARER